MGWRHDMADLIRNLDDQVKEGTELWLFCALSADSRSAAFERAELQPEKDLRRLRLRHAFGDPVARRDLAALPLEKFSSALILASGSMASTNSNGAGAEPDGVASTDSRTLATLLLVRDIQTTRHARAMAQSSRLSAKGSSWMVEMRKLAGKRCEVVTEILDTRTRALLAEMQCCDYVLSNELVSKALAMIRCASARAGGGGLRRPAAGVWGALLA